MNADFAANELIRCYIDSPHPSYKVSHYFQIYAELFAHLRGTECTFIEAGVLNGGFRSRPHGGARPHSRSQTLADA